MECDVDGATTKLLFLQTLLVYGRSCDVLLSCIYSMTTVVCVLLFRLCVMIEREMFPDDYPITYYLLVTEHFTIQHLLDMVSEVKTCYDFPGYFIFWYVD